MKAVSVLHIDLSDIAEGLQLIIEAQKEHTLFDGASDAVENNEARWQLLEGHFYDYELTDTAYRLGDIGENIVQQHRRQPNLGTLAPNIFVGTLTVPVLDADTAAQCGTVTIEVQSLKAGYRDDYRDMLELITEKCTGLLLQSNAPASHHFEVDHTHNAHTLYQRFAFISSVIASPEFSEAIHRIVSAPVTRWHDEEEQTDVRGLQRFSARSTRELLRSGGKRSAIPSGIPLSKLGLTSIPERIASTRKTDSVDAPENRFVRHALETFLKFCTDIHAQATPGSRLACESDQLIKGLENHLHHPIFTEISNPTTLKLNSPVLQRKEGYREVLRAWLMFDLAAKLIWTGGDDIYKGGKKDIATLYEYWLFFQLLDLLQSVFTVEPRDTADLIKETADGLNLQLKQGQQTALSGVYDAGSRKLNVRFCYNRSFSGAKKYPASGSWTTAMRPDYTLSFWPHGITEAVAEQQELIVHIHFDAKYKVDSLSDVLDQQAATVPDNEKTQQRKGVYKNADLLKMHAYKDAIRRTGGAYVLYPGDASSDRRGFHEIIPGLGAFPVRPSRTDTGITALRSFILGVVDHFLNRTSQREKMAFRTYDIHKGLPDDFREDVPEPYGANRALIPDETFVLVGFFRTEAQYNWIRKTGLYNFRMGSGRGALLLDADTVSARYLLLHTTGDQTSGNLWKIKSKGPRIFSREDVIRKGYPDPSADHYLLIEIEPVTEPELQNKQWDFRKLANYQSGRASGLPFTASLVELVKVENHESL